MPCMCSANTDHNYANAHTICGSAHQDRVCNHVELAAAAAALDEPAAAALDGPAELDEPTALDRPAALEELGAHDGPE